MLKYSKNGVSVLVVLDTRRAKKNGHFPVKVEIVHRRQQKYISTGVDLAQEEWAKLDSSRRKNPAAQTIVETFGAVVKDVDELLSSGRFNFEFLKRRMSSKGSSTVNAALAAMAEKFKEQGRVNSYYRCRSTLLNLEAFAGNDIQFRDLTPEWLARCDEFWTLEGKKRTTVAIYMRTLKVVFNEARTNGYISPEANPFGRGAYMIPKGAVRKLALTKEQIRKIIEYSGTPTAEKYRDLWLFSYLCNGINFKDMLFLQYKNIVDGEICFVRSKTAKTYGTAKVIKATLTPQMKAIIRRWGNPYNGDPDTYIFKYAEGIRGEFQADTMVRKVIWLCNRALKQIASELGLPAFTTYSARHSYATILHHSGVNVSFISESLGHSSLAMTEIYLAGFGSDERKKNAALLTKF